jgi:hypothetical protein
MAEAATITAVIPETAEVYGLFGTWPRFRFAERDIGQPWEAVAAVDDAALARGNYRLGGQVRDASDLEIGHQAHLENFLRAGKLTPEEDGELSALLECCPFLENLPPIDVDPQGDQTPAEIEAFALRFDLAWRTAGLGTIQWFTTGGRGLHGHLAPPKGLRSPCLMRAYGGLVRRVAQRADLPLLTHHRSKDGRPPILLDDSLFDRDAAGRGGLWRLQGSPHSKTGRLKTLHATLPNEAPTVTDVLRDRVLQACSDLEQVDDHGKIRRKPRERTARGRLPKSITQIQRADQLPRVAAAIQQVMPGEGFRHEFRKALAGWLLREGVAPKVVGATVAAAGDAADGYAVAKTTAARLEAGRNVTGFKSLVGIVAAERATILKSALYEDLRAANVPEKALGQWTDTAKKMLMKESAVIADRKGFPTRARALRRAARCGLAQQVEVCSPAHGGCGEAFNTTRLIANRATCEHCAWRRCVSTLNWIMTRWPKELWVVTKELEDKSYAAAKAEVKKWRKRLTKPHRGHVRWLVAPGFIVAIAGTHRIGGILVGWADAGYGWKRPPSTKEFPNGQPKSIIIEHLLPILQARALHIRRFLEKGDVEGLANDDWVDRCLEARGGKEARALLPWPSKTDLRLMAVNAARAKRGEDPIPPGATFPGASLQEQRAKRSPCCHKRIDYECRCAETGALISLRDDRRWRFAEGSVRADLGWRDEELRFDDAGVSLIVVLPDGWDPIKLIE